jgi:undecaprenyl pyrophosphate phosphatase UppP
LFRNFNETTALRLSFIMSLPIVLAGNILLNFRDFAFVKGMFLGVLAAFAVGILAIHALMKFSEKVKFGAFALVFGILVIIAGILNFFF